MNAVANARVCYQLLDHIHGQSQGILSKRDGTGITFGGGAVLDRGVYAVGKAQ